MISVVNRRFAGNYIICLLLLLSMLVGGPGKAYCAGNAQSPEKVYIGLYANQLLSLNIKENNYEIDYYLWFRWKNPLITPHKTIELINGKQSCQMYDDKTYNNSRYAIFRCTSKITKFWELNRFPLDDQHLDIIFEDDHCDSRALQYVADTESTNINKLFLVNGWSLGRISTNVSSHTYETSFGDPALSTKSNSNFSRYTYSIHLVRGMQGFGVAFKLLFPVFVAMLISMLQYCVTVDASLRFSLAVGSIFAAVGSTYATTSSLPANSYLSVAELANLLTFFFVLCALCGSAYSLNVLKTSGDIARSNRFDRKFGIALLCSYLVLMFLILFVYGM